MKTLAVEPKSYRDAMARFAGHVHIAATVHEGERRGVTITAACSVTDDPATIMVCLNGENPKNELFQKSGIFSLNTLGAMHRELSDAFAGFGQLSQEERFALGVWETLETGAPVLKSAIAAFDCRIVDTKRISTHTVYFAEVVGLKTGEAEKPLIYFDRGYHTL